MESNATETKRTASSTAPAAAGGRYQRLFPLARLGWVIAAGAAWYVRPHLGPWIVAAAALPWLVHALRTGQLWHRTPFDAPLLLFLATAALSMGAAYDPQGSSSVFPAPMGWPKSWGLVLAVLVFDAVAALATEPQRRLLVLLLSGLGAAVALWFLISNDWDAAKLTPAFIPRLGRAIQAPLPALPGHRLNPNVAGGLLALTLPMALTLIGDARRGPAASLAAAWGAASAALMGLGLLLTASRGAWVAAGCVLGLTLAWSLAGAVAQRRRRVAALAALVLIPAVAATVALATVPALRALVGESAVVSNRLAIFSQALLLVRDYPFTGFGLGQFPLVHSTYALLIHVPVLVFAHSTPLDVALEQGLPAALALLAVWVGAAAIGLRALGHAARPPTGLAAGLLSLAVVVVHGAVDSTIYGSRALLLLWLPVGLIVAAARQTAGDALPDHNARPTNQGRQGPGNCIAADGTQSSPGAGNGEGAPGGARAPRAGLRRHWWAPAAAGLALVVGLLFWRTLAAAWHANLGAVHQTLVELRTYDYHRFGDPTLAEVREIADLSTAEGHFHRALGLDPGQPTARTRLSQIAHARGAYDEALHHARAAWDAGHRDRITRLVLGDALVAHGRVDDAVAIVRGLERAAMRLNGQGFYQYHRQGDHQRAAYARAAAEAVGP